MKRITLYKAEHCIIVRHSHYPATKIYRQSPFSVYHIQQLLAYQHAFDLTDMFREPPFEKINYC
ncbi:hypothetical protein [Kurthia huakuii]|uniref:hypothetical protein n=1 Tax=Kurthia huakuii TaxID=1421019 RepID=UPI0004B78A1F|nr:hypothetical protein [Kurthia huakuii]MBM7699774.1 hypothetical protein [Kurthia huakuii]